MTIKLRKWDSAEHLKTEEDMALYLQACMDEAGDDAAFIASALGTIARARGMSQLARDTGLGRESLYPSCAESPVLQGGDAERGHRRFPL
ncbi:MAG: putative addiction module antidote protein [Polaromonas sp.]|nr:putative addiction module antidote protein [Polaromonas sp.]